MNTARSPSPTPQLLVIIESVAIALLGFAVMTFLYVGSTDKPGAEIGVPEHDSFYHIKMALLMPELGLLREFPWLQYVYFTRDGNAFVSHHFGFQLYLAPFVHASRWLTGDPLPGARWAIATCFGLNLMLFNLLLRQGSVPMRWLWIVLFLLLPDQFFGRHSFIRAIGLSLAVMQLVLLFLFRGRGILAALAIALYIQVYLGGVLYVPVIVAAYAVGHVLAPADERRWPIAMAAWSFAGWLAGVLVYPYRNGMLEFLRLQVFGSGLSPNIEVGLEWRPYTDAWFLVRMSAVLLGVWTLVLVVRTRTGPKLDARETALLIVNFVYLLLTLKARRFIEYWPFFALLSAAYMSRPALALVRERCADGLRRLPVAWRAGVISLALYALFIASAAGIARGVARDTAALGLAEWQLWTAVTLLLGLAPVLATLWSRTAIETAGERAASDGGRADAAFRALSATLAGGLLVAAGCIVLVVRFVLTKKLPPPRMPVPLWTWGAIGLLYTLTPVALAWRRPTQCSAAFGRTLGRALTVAGGLVVLFGGTAVLAAGKFGDLARGTRCMYDLAEIRRVMDFIRERSAPGEIIFTDDWDVFPVYFYINSHNYYIVGLDPKFTHERRPDLWARFVRISRGETPARSQVEYTSGPRAGERESIDIDLADIREHFQARWVIVDSDHRRFASRLLDRPDIAELVYPCTDFVRCNQAQYWVFRLRAPDEGVPAPPQPDADGALPLARLRPTAHTQGYGMLQTDRTVDERDMEMRGISYRYGLGTHAPSTTVYEIPPGYDAFEAVVGIDDETDGLGSAVAEILLDGKSVYRSPTLTGQSPPASVFVPLNGAAELVLRTDATSDGNRFDHVNWADARLLRAAATRPTSTAPTRPADPPRGATELGP